MTPEKNDCYVTLLAVIHPTPSRPRPRPINPTNKKKQPPPQKKAVKGFIDHGADSNALSLVFFWRGSPQNQRPLTG